MRIKQGFHYRHQINTTGSSGGLPSWIDFLSTNQCSICRNDIVSKTNQTDKICENFI